jgi:pyridoxine kinase
MILIKRVAAIHDISGVGKCSLTAAIPIISCAGVECNPIPTAVLSTHTGNIKGYTFTDLTDDIIPYCKHWNSLGIFPDTIYTGYLGSAKQVQIVIDSINLLKKENTKIIVDPAMADSGILYKGFDNNFPAKMSFLCKEADIIVPNITEACLMTGTEYKTNYDSIYIENLLYKLSDFTKRFVILTGVSFSEDKIGCSIFDKETQNIRWLFSEKYDGTYYGTGDIFASVIAAGITKGFDCNYSTEIALEFVRRAIKETFENKTDTRFGVTFENHLPFLIKSFGGQI